MKIVKGGVLMLALSMTAGCSSLDSINERFVENMRAQVEKADAVRIVIGYDGPIVSSTESVAVVIDSGISIRSLDGTPGNAVFCSDSCRFRKLKSEYHFGGNHVDYWFLTPGKHTVEVHYSDSRLSLGNRTIEMNLEAKAGEVIRISKQFVKDGGFMSGTRIRFLSRIEPDLPPFAEKHLAWALRVTQEKAAKK